MPRLTAELTPERDAEIRARAERARLRALSAAKPSTAEVLHTTSSRARSAASRVGAPGTEIGAEPTSAGWVGVVYLRPDQTWMERHVRERGCRPVVLS